MLPTPATSTAAQVVIQFSSLSAGTLHVYRTDNAAFPLDPRGLPER